ncbi:MAG: hypothetical protein IJ099_00200 [Alphaproteobacteria bacterium]|nr:hypothetical protein [Alphaproteobacteria bacterium]
MNKNNLHFFLGGADLEMATIKKLLEKEGVAYSDGNLNWWDASVAAYKDEIEKVAKKGKTPVIVELATKDKDGKDIMVLPKNTEVIDHHNAYAGKPASVLQVCKLLGVEPTAQIKMIAANDVGSVGEMIKFDMPELSAEEKLSLMKYVRSLDKKTQGVTEEHELSGQKAAKEAIEVCGVKVALLKGYSKCAPVTDALAFSQFEKDPQEAQKNFKQNEVIISEMPDKTFEVNYFGPADICGKNNENFGGWIGSGKETNFWGKDKMSKDDMVKVVSFILTQNQEKQKEKSSKVADAVMAKILSDFKGNGK